MDHREASALLSPYVDGELAAGEAAALDAHLADCAQCRTQHAALLALAGGIRKGGDYHRAPPALAQRIDAALPAAPAAAAVPTPRRTRPRLAWTWLNAGVALASIMAIVTSASLYLALPGHDDRVADEVVSSHVRALLSGRAVDVASSDQHTVKPWFSGKLDFSPPVLDLTTDGFPLVGGRVDYLAHRSVAALVYRHRQHTIDVYVLPAAAKAKDAPAARLSRQGYNLLHWTRGGMDFWAVSDLDAGELQALENILATR